MANLSSFTLDLDTVVRADGQLCRKLVIDDPSAVADTITISKTGFNTIYEVQTAALLTSNAISAASAPTVFVAESAPLVELKIAQNSSLIKKLIVKIFGLR